MTPEEAIKQLEFDRDMILFDPSTREKTTPEMLKLINKENYLTYAADGVAIEALKEIQLYKDNKLCLVPEDVYSRQCCELDAYKEIGTVDECREAVEKKKPKKPIPINHKVYADKIANAEFLEDSYFCPNCGTVIRSGSCCSRCGQKLNWNENLEGMEE